MSPPTARATNVTPVAHKVAAADRCARNGHAGGVLWLTGLPGAGKTTLAIEAEKRLFELGYQVYVLDGDELRHGLSADLDFAPSARAENIRRVGEVAALMARAGLIAIAAFISPYRSDRAGARRAAGKAEKVGFHEIHVRADLATCERRDPKGHYKQARAGLIADFTGIGAPYETPDSPDLVVDTSHDPVAVSVARLVDYAAGRFHLDR